jgi:hypothetical protein
MPSAQTNWQVRRCATPSTVARHSMQTPIPQSGPRASPRTENRHGSFAIISAAATLVPGVTRTSLPLIVMEHPSLIHPAPLISKAIPKAAQPQNAVPFPDLFIIAYNFVF